MVDYSKGRKPEELEPFFPNEMLRHTLLTFFFVSAVMLGVLFIPESFQKSTDEFAAYQTKPIMWFLMPFYKFSNIINYKTVYIAIITVYAIIFISVPFLDRNPKKSLWKKPIFLSIVIVNIVMIVVLGLMYNIL